MKALIDFDIFSYEFGNCSDAEYRPLAWPLVQARLQGRIDKILEATGADCYQGYLTSSDKSNFRYDIATIRPYKGQRVSEKPHHYDRIRSFLVEYRGAIMCYGQEADDAMSIEQYRSNKEELWNEGDADFCETVIATRDKDLDMVPGYHYNWGAGKQVEKNMWFQDKIGGQRCFYKQLLTGDTVDNIPGLFGVGKSSSHVKRIDTYDTVYDMYSAVLLEYKKRFGSYAEQFLTENAILLWMREFEDEIWKPPVLTPSTEQ